MNSGYNQGQAGQAALSKTAEMNRMERADGTIGGRIAPPTETPTFEVMFAQAVSSMEHLHHGHNRISAALARLVGHGDVIAGTQGGKEAPMPASMSGRFEMLTHCLAAEASRINEIANHLERAI